jgi:NADH dehydrogenase FAD-containing subunit
MLADVEGTTVSLSYRGDKFNRVAAETRERLDAAVAAGRVRLLLNTQVAKIEYETVHLSGSQGPLAVRNDTVIVQAGGTAPTEFLRQIGILVDVHHGIRVVREGAT